MDGDHLTTDLAALKIDREERPRRGVLKPILIVVAIAGVVAAVWLVGYPYLSSRVFKTQVDLTEISLVSPAQGSIELTATGYVVALTKANVAAKTVGRVAQLMVKEGDVVKKGDVVALLDDTSARSSVASAKARVAAARARAQTARANVAEVAQQVAREKVLAQKGVSPQAVVDDLTARQKALTEMARAADAEVAAAQSEVDSLDVVLADTRVTAPIDGTVTEKLTDPGELVGPMMGSAGGNLVTLVDFSSLVVEIDIPESKLSLVKLGSPCETVLDAFAGRRYRCVTHEIGKKVDRSKATVKVKVRFVDPPEGALPDMAARVSFLAKELDAAAMKEPPKLVVPQNAVVDRPGGGAKAVYVVDQGTLRLTNVQVVDTFGDAFVLKQGPPPGTKVVSRPGADLRDGQSIKEKNE